MDQIIQIENLSKSYGNLQAVKDISFFVKKGKLFAFLGPQRRRKVNNDQHHLHLPQTQRRLCARQRL